MGRYVKDIVRLPSGFQVDFSTSVQDAALTANFRTDLISIRQEREVVHLHHTNLRSSAASTVYRQ
jgi:hypothetical protein